jgi:hypothetical protein
MQKTDPPRTLQVKTSLKTRLKFTVGAKRQKQP